MFVAATTEYPHNQRCSLCSLNIERTFCVTWLSTSYTRSPFQRCVI